MLKKKIYSIFLISLFLCIETFSENQILVENIIQVGDKLRLFSKENGEVYEWIVLNSPKYSSAKFYSEDEVVYVEPDIAGEYTVKLTLDKEETVFFEFDAVPRSSESVNEILEKLELYYEAGNSEKYKEYFNKFIAGYPENDKIKHYIMKGIDLDNNNGLYGKEYLKFITQKFVLSKEESEKYLLSLYNIYLREYDYENAKKCILKLFKIDKEKYAYNYAEVLFKENEKKALTILESLFNKNADVRAARLLSNYYQDKDEKIAKKYLLVANKKKYLEKYWNEIPKVQKEVIRESIGDEEYVFIEKIKLNEAKFEDYYIKGKSSLDEYNFEMAELYFLKLITESSEKYTGKAYYNLGKAYFLQRKYNESLDYFNKFESEYSGIFDPELHYYKARIYFNQKEFEKSRGSLEHMIRTYPNTVWENRAKIYLSKITDRKES